MAEKGGRGTEKVSRAKRIGRENKVRERTKRGMEVSQADCAYSSLQKRIKEEWEAMEKKEQEEKEKKRKQKEAKEVCTMDWYPTQIQQLSNSCYK